MDWLGVLFFVIAVIVFIAMRRPPPIKFRAATNALLAEQFLGHVELVPDNPVAKAIADGILLICREPTFPVEKKAAPIELFNDASRFVQLNIIAMVLNKLNCSPLLPGEIWHTVNSPFYPGLEDANYIRDVANRLKLTTNTELEIPSRKLKIKPWGLCDEDADANDKPLCTESFQAHPPVPFSSSLPDVTKCEALRIYEIGNYVALVVENAKPYAATAGFDLNVVEYIYAMVVSNANPPGPPLLFVTAERSGSDLTAMLHNATGHRQTSDPFLCVFDSTGSHDNLGCSSDFTDLGIFSAYALKVARDRLRIREEAVELN